MAKILVAEDDHIIGPLLKEILECSAYEVILVQDGQEALRIWDESFNLLITDFEMPFLNGGQLISAIRAKGDTRSIIQMSSGYDVEELALDLGATAFLAKPFSIKELLETVKILSKV